MQFIQAQQKSATALMMIVMAVLTALYVEAAEAAEQAAVARLTGYVDNGQIARQTERKTEHAQTQITATS
jgi:hypothetical protein